MVCIRQWSTLDTHHEHIWTQSLLSCMWFAAVQVYNQWSVSRRVGVICSFQLRHRSPDGQQHAEQTAASGWHRHWHQRGRRCSSRLDCVWRKGPVFEQHQASIIGEWTATVEVGRNSYVWGRQRDSSSSASNQGRRQGHVQRRVRTHRYTHNGILFVFTSICDDTNQTNCVFLAFNNLSQSYDIHLSNSWMQRSWTVDIDALVDELLVGVTYCVLSEDVDRAEQQSTRHQQHTEWIAENPRQNSAEHLARERCSRMWRLGRRQICAYCRQGNGCKAIAISK